MIYTGYPIDSGTPKVEWFVGTNYDTFTLGMLFFVGH